MKPNLHIATPCNLKAHPTPSTLLLLALFALPIAALAAGVVYKSVDETGHVTYSTEPPRDAVETEAMHVPPGPSAETTEMAIERAREMEQKADARFEAMAKRRQEEAQARRDEERLRLDGEAAERHRKLDDSSERLDRERVYFPVYPPYWRGIYRPHPPVHLPHPPKPARPVVRPQMGSHSHINPPTRRWLRDGGY